MLVSGIWREDRSRASAADQAACGSHTDAVNNANNRHRMRYLRSNRQQPLHVREACENVAHFIKGQGVPPPFKFAALRASGELLIILDVGMEALVLLRRASTLVRLIAGSNSHTGRTACRRVEDARRPFR